MFAGGLSNIQSASRTILHSSPEYRLFTQLLFTQMHLNLVEVLKLTMAITRVVSGQSRSHSNTNYLELSAVKLALESLCDNRSNIQVRFMSDNTTTVSYQFHGRLFIKQMQLSY